MAIHQANLARRHLTRLGVRTPVLKDERQVAGRRNSFAFFTQSRFKSGDYKNMKVNVAAGLAGREWKALTDEQKKVRRLELPFIQLLMLSSLSTTWLPKTRRDIFRSGRRF